jgi:hypothetical protein
MVITSLTCLLTLALKNKVIHPKIDRTLTALVGLVLADAGNSRVISETQ